MIIKSVKLENWAKNQKYPESVYVKFDDGSGRYYKKV